MIFWIQPLTPWRKEVQQMFPISSLPALPHHSLHCSEGERSLEWICFSCPVTATTSQCWDTVSECYHATREWFGILKCLLCSPITQLLHHQASSLATFSPHLCTQPKLRHLGVFLNTSNSGSRSSNNSSWCGVWILAHTLCPHLRSRI